MTDIAAQETTTSARWSLGGIFLEALATRDYKLMATTLGPTIRFRALLPPGPMELDLRIFRSSCDRAVELSGWVMLGRCERMSSAARCG